jgi:uncharacterized protein YjbJ (UPF0337 family)
LCSENIFTGNLTRMENLTETEGSWDEVKGKLKQRFAMLNDQDVVLTDGKHEEMMGRLQKKLGITKEELHKLINEL